MVRKTLAGSDDDTFADDLGALMQTLDLEKAILVGFCMATGEVARYFTRDGNDRVRKAVFLAT